MLKIAGIHFLQIGPSFVGSLVNHIPYETFNCHYFLIIKDVTKSIYYGFPFTTSPKLSHITSIISHTTIIGEPKIQYLIQNICIKFTEKNLHDLFIPLKDGFDYLQANLHVIETKKDILYQNIAALENTRGLGPVIKQKLLLYDLAKYIK